MTIQISQWRKVTTKTWHTCWNMGCQNGVFGTWSVCLKCWIEHLAAHGIDFSLLKSYKYNLSSIKAIGKLSV